LGFFFAGLVGSPLGSVEEPDSTEVPPLEGRLPEEPEVLVEGELLELELEAPDRILVVPACEAAPVPGVTPVEGSSRKGSWALPPFCSLKPSVVSATARSGVVAVTATPLGGTGACTPVVGAAAPLPPSSA
jgi:hypothetical protein